MIVAYAPEYRAQLERLLRDIHAESAFSPLTLDMEKLMGTLLGLQVRLRLAVSEGKVVGCFAGYLQAPYFSADTVAYDLGWYVAKGSRGGVYAVRLLQDFEDWAKEQGAKLVVLAQTTGIAVAEVGQLYSRSGYTIVGACAMKEI